MTKSVLWFLTALGIVLHLSVSPTFAGWKEKVTKNQQVATEYILQLKAGKKVSSLTRPHLRRSDNYKAKQSRREIAKLMDHAETLARAGKHDQIKEPEFTIQGLSN